MPKAVVLTIVPHAAQRYPTVGDWEYIGEHKDTLAIRVSDTGDMRYSMLLMLHELVEAFLCEHRGISEETVTKWDLDYEVVRGTLEHTFIKTGIRATLPDEPGDHPDSPYRAEHHSATHIEVTFAQLLGVSWSAYERALKQLEEK